MIHLALIVTMIIWSFNAVILKWLLVSVSPNMLVLLRILIATLFLGLLFTINNNKFRIGLPELAYAVFGGFLYIYLQLTIHFMGLAQISAANAVLITALAPSVSMLFEFVILKKRFSGSELLGLMVAFVGVTISLIGYQDQKYSLLGSFFIFTSVLIACMGGIFIQKLSIKNGSLTVALMIHISGLFSFIIDAVLIRNFDFGEFSLINRMGWFLIIVFSVINGGLGSIVWSRGVANLGLAKASAYLPLVPFCGVFIGAIVFGEQLTKWHFFGLIGLVMGSALIINTSLLKCACQKKLIQ